MKLNQIATSDQITNNLLEKVLAHSTLFRNHVEFYTGPGGASQERKVQGAQEISTRAVNEGYTPKVLEPKYFVTGRKIYGDTARVDVYYEKAGYDISSEMLSQVLRFAPGIAAKFHQLFIKGDADKNAKDFNGIEKMCLAENTIKAGTNGLQILLGNDKESKISQQSFLEKLDETIAVCKGVNKIIIVNARTVARLNSIAREYIQYTTDTFGKRIVSYNGYSLVNIEEYTDGVIPFDETIGTATDTASLYVVSLAERSDLSFFTVPGGFTVYPVQKVSNFYEAMIDIIMDTALFNDKAIARLQGIKV